MRLTHRPLVVVLALAALFLAPAYARADRGHGPKVESSLAAAIESAGTGELHVMVYGSDLLGVDSDLKLTPRNDLDVVGAQSVTIPADKVDALAAHAGVSYMTLDRPVIPTGDPPAAASFSATSLLTLFPVVDGAAELWAQGITGAGVGIALVDSGVTPRGDFGERLVQVKLPAQDGTKLDDSVGHGSFVAGVAAGASANGKYLGVAPGATVYAVNVAREDGVYTSDVVAGLRWVLLHAKERNIRVVNLSLSETTPSQYTASTLDALVEQLWRAGVVVVASAGNLGPDSMLYAPGNDPFAITVGASDPADTAGTGDDALVSWSSRGETQAGYDKPEIVAPGRHIVSVVPDGSALALGAPAANVVRDGAALYLRMNGTSFSAPQVAGAAALLLQRYPGLTPDQVKWALTKGVRPLAGSDAGALDLAGAVAAAASPGKANQDVPYSTWARPGAGTAVFVGMVSASIRAQAWERSAQVWERNAAKMCDLAASWVSKAKQGLAFWARCAGDWERAGEAWDNAADAWGDAAKPDAASEAAKSAAAAWQTASDAWKSATVPNRAAAAWDRAAAAWDRAAAWDKAAAWDRAAAWDKAAAWDRAAAWDVVAAWD